MYTIQCTLLNTVECRGIMFQLLQNDNIYIVGTKTILGAGKHAYYYMPYVILINHVTNSNYKAQKTVKLLHLFF